MVDISDRKQAEEALQDSEEQLRLITDALPVCISYVDKKQRYQFNNKTYEDWFGLSRSELKGRHLKEVLGASAYELIRGAVEEALSGQAVNFEATLPYVGGGERYVVADFIPYVADQGKVMGFFVLATDISERNRVEKALRKSEDRPATKPGESPDAGWPTNVCSLRTSAVVLPKNSMMTSTSRWPG